MTSTGTEAPKPEPAAKPKKPVAKTEYKILQKDGDGLYKLVGAINAVGANAAIRNYAQAKGTTGVFVAVPARSWAETTVTVETRTTVKLA